MTSAAAPPPSASSERALPPVAILATVALGCVIIAGILMASYAPRRPPLGAPGALLALGAVTLVVAFVMLARIREFAWGTFAMVYRWALLAYAISAGMIGFAFVHDHVTGSPLAVVAGSLVVFATSVPLAIAFTVARYADR